LRKIIRATVAQKPCRNSFSISLLDRVAKVKKTQPENLRFPAKIQGVQVSVDQTVITSSSLASRAFSIRVI